MKTLIFQNSKFLDEIYNNLPKGLFGTNAYKILELC